MHKRVSTQSSRQHRHYTRAVNLTRGVYFYAGALVHIQMSSSSVYPMAMREARKIIDIPLGVVRDGVTLMNLTAAVNSLSNIEKSVLSREFFFFYYITTPRRGALSIVAIKKFRFE